MVVELVAAVVTDVVVDVVEPPVGLTAPDVDGRTDGVVEVVVVVVVVVVAVVVVVIVEGVETPSPDVVVVSLFVGHSSALLYGRHSLREKQ